MLLGRETGNKLELRFRIVGLTPVLVRWIVLLIGMIVALGGFYVWDWMCLWSLCHYFTLSVRESPMCQGFKRALVEAR